MLHLTQQVVIDMYTRYGYPDVNLGVVQAGYRNTSFSATAPDGSKLNLLLHKSEPGILARLQRTMYLGTQLHDDGLPVRSPKDDRILQLSLGDTTYLGVLYAYLPGDTIPWEAYTMNHIKLLGWSMARMHTAMRDISEDLFPRVEDEYLQYFSHMQQYFETGTVAAAAKAKLGIAVPNAQLFGLHNFLKAMNQTVDRQVLHMDYVRGNVLFAGSDAVSEFTLGSVKLTGIIDLEKAAVGHVLFDVARTLAFLLVDCAAKTPREIYKYFLISGYRKRGGGIIPDQEQLETAVDLFLLYDLYKFMRDTPYESLTQNHHYIRTRDILVRRKMLHYT